MLTFFIIYAFQSKTFDPHDPLLPMRNALLERAPQDTASLGRELFLKGAFGTDELMSKGYISGPERQLSYFHPLTATHPVTQLDLK